MQVNSQTVITVKDGHVAVLTTETPEALFLLLSRAAADILNRGPSAIDGTPSVQLHTEGELTQTEKILSRMNGKIEV